MYTTVEIVSQLLRCSTLAHLFYARTRSQNSGQDCDLCDSQSIEGATFIVISDRTNSQFAFSNLQSAMLMTPTLSLLITPPPLTQSRCIGTPPLPEQIELHRDRMWRRDEDLRVESAVDAERFIEDVGFANTLKP